MVKGDTINEKKLEYEVTKKTEYQYGYLIWSIAEIPSLKEFFPENEFTVEIKGKTIPNRKMDWETARLCLYPARDLINEGETLELEREEDRIVISEK